jgi:hypothetical protein
VSPGLMDPEFGDGAVEDDGAVDDGAVAEVF